MNRTNVKIEDNLICYCQLLHGANEAALDALQSTLCNNEKLLLRRQERTYFILLLRLEDLGEAYSLF